MRIKSGEGALAVREASDDDAAQIQREKSWPGQAEHAIRECAQGRMARNTAGTQTARIARAWRGRGGRGLGSSTGQGQRELRIRSAAQKGTPDHNLETLEESERRDAAGSRVK